MTLDLPVFQKGKSYGGSGEGYGYVDTYADGTYYYCGEGQVGDMQFRGGNRALLNHAAEGKAVHLFRTTGKGLACVYEGEFSVAGHHISKGRDRNGDDRDIIVFHLVDVDSFAGQLDEAEEKDADGAVLKDLRARALIECRPTSQSPGGAIVRNAYKRSLHVKRYVLAREDGCCRGCGQPAPFRTPRGEPYLEPHHTNRLADGGLDHFRHVVALCPNCHARIHWGENGEAYNNELKAWLEANET